MSAAKAIAYYRTSSAANVGSDKDSLARQKAAVTAYAKAHGIRFFTRNEAIACHVQWVAELRVW